MKLEELSRLLREVDPAAVLVAPAVLSRVIQNVTGMSWSVWGVPHDHCFLVDRFTLYKHVEPDELHLAPDQRLPDDAVILLARPNADQLAGPRDELLSRYWRLLFHASVHRDLERLFAILSSSDFRERVERLGPAAFEEARNVLTQDGLLGPKADDRAAYVEFAAYFLELKYFTPNLIPVYFPSLPPAAEVEALLARDVDGARLFRSTRLPDAPDPAPKTDDQSDESHDFYHRLVRAARRSNAAGDTVGAAILHTRAARVAPAALTGPAQQAARQDIYHLVSRLQKALGLTDAEAENWRRVLPALLDKADQGTRPVEASLLYDLQRACLDDEQKIYTLDVAEWLVSAGHKPIKRELDGQRFVRVPTQLRSATRRLAAARLNDADRQALAGLLRDAQGRAEQRLRGRFRPTLTDALLDAGLQPRSLPELAALEKTVEELLDRISAVGYLTFGDVRDAVARGQVKLPDLSEPQEYLRGDPLLRLDRRLAHDLDGVYRRGEFYVRWLERATAFTFGTNTGRWITRNLVLPFGGAFLAGEFVWLVVAEKRLKAARKEAGEPPPAPKETWDTFLGGWNTEWWFHLGWLTLALCLLAVVRSAAVRGALVGSAKGAYRAARFVFWDLPVRVWADPRVRAVIRSGPVQLGLNYVAKPLALTALIWGALPNPNPDRDRWDSTNWPWLLIAYVAAALMINTRLGRNVESVVWEFLRGLVEFVRSAPALLRWVSDLFAEMLDTLEWVLARAEDWLRIRGRGGPLAVAVRAVAGVVWMPFAFLLRFYTVVLIEPMVNPLKLPLTLVFAKFVYPLLAVLGVFTFVWEWGPDGWPVFHVTAAGVETLAGFLPYGLAFAAVFATFWLLPDAFTYLFWEMRENWRLYRANRPAALRPVMVGPHGETVKGLLHYGFHSGTVPRLYARLRAAELLATRTDEWTDARTYRQALRDVGESVRRFVARDLVAVLNPSPSWGGRALAVGEVTLGTNRIRVQLRLEGEPLAAWLEWEDRSGWLVARWADPGFLADLPAGPAWVLENALAYLYKLAGVDLVREQVRAALPKEAAHFDVGPAGLLVWYGSREGTPVLYDIADPVAELRPRNPADLKPTPGPTLDARRVVFRRTVLTWTEWTDLWRDGRPGEPDPRFGPPDLDLVLLPRRTAPPAEPPRAAGGDLIHRNGQAEADHAPGRNGRAEPGQAPPDGLDGQPEARPGEESGSPGDVPGVGGG